MNLSQLERNYGQLNYTRPPSSFTFNRFCISLVILTMSSPPAMPYTSMLSSSPMKGFNYYFPPEVELHEDAFMFQQPPLLQPVKVEITNNHGLQVNNQENLYPPMHVFHAIPHSQSTDSITSSTFLSASTSEQSITSQGLTPRARRLSASFTPLTQIYESPHKTSPTPLRTPRRLMHRRTKSRLSLDASGCASIVTETKSPGTNPFYQAFMSPQHTPLRTPHCREHLHENHGQIVSPDLLIQPQQQSTPLITLSIENLGQPFSIEPSKLPKHFQTQSLIRSQSSIDLASIAHSPPPEVTKFDILEPRRKKITRQVADPSKAQHSCPLCGGVFQRPEHVKRHMRSHSSEKPFQCEECGKKFNRTDNLRAHLRKKHQKV